MSGHPDLVGLPDLARDALAVLDRPHLAGQHATCAASRSAWPTRPANAAAAEHGTPFLPDMTATVPQHNPQPYNDGSRAIRPSGFFPLDGGVPPAALDRRAGKTT